MILNLQKNKKEDFIYLDEYDKQILKYLEGEKKEYSRQIRIKQRQKNTEKDVK